jgi:hypothetical protein
MSSSGSVKLRYENCLEIWGNAKGLIAREPTTENQDLTPINSIVRMI